MEKVLFAPIYDGDSVLKLLFDLNPVDRLVLFVDEKKPTKQSEYYNLVSGVAKKQGIKFEEVILPLYDMVEIATEINKLVEKYKKFEMYFDISRSKRTQGFAILNYLSVKKPENLKNVIYYSRSDSLNVNVPVPRAEELSETEIKALKYINKNSKFFQKDLAEYLNMSAMHSGRILDGLEQKRLINRDSGYELTDLGEIYLL